MVQPQALKKALQVRKDLTRFHKRASQIFSDDKVILHLMAHRKYDTQEMFDTLKEMGMFYIDSLSDITLLMPEFTTEQLRDFGLLTENGSYLLSGRYVLPIKDINGTVISLVGWLPAGGPRKYVTAPTFGFSRDTSFFNADCYRYSLEKYNGIIYIVEGIFDSISLKSIGLPVWGNQGLEMSAFKVQMLNRFRKKIPIPDNDNAGRSVNPFLNKASGKDPHFIWHIEGDSVFTILPKGVKDCDDFVKEYDCRDDLLSLQNKKYMYTLHDDEEDTGTSTSSILTLQ